MAFIWHSAAAASAEALDVPPPDPFQTWSVEPRVGKYPRARSSETGPELLAHMEFAAPLAGFNSWSVEPPCRSSNVTNRWANSSNLTAMAFTPLLALFANWSVDQSSLPRPLSRLLILSTSSAAQPPAEASAFDLSVEPVRRQPKYGQPTNESWTNSPVAQPLTSLGWFVPQPPPRPLQRLMVLDFVDGSSPTTNIAPYFQFSVEWPEQGTVPPRILETAAPVGTLIPQAPSGFVEWSPTYSHGQLKTQPATSWSPLTALSFGSGYPLSIEPSRVPTSTNQPGSTQPIGSPFPFAPVAFQQWSSEPPRVSAKYVSRVEFSTEVFDALSFGSGYPLSVEHPRAPVVNRRPVSAEVIGAPFPFAPMPFQQWSVDPPRTSPTYVRRSELSTQVFDPLSFGAGFPLSIEPPAHRPVVPNRPESTVTFGTVSAPPPLPFANWTIDAGRWIPPVYRPVPQTEPLSALQQPAVTQFQQWSIEPARPRGQSARRLETAQPPPSLLSISPFVQWSQPRPFRYDPDRILAGNVVPLTPLVTGWYELASSQATTWISKPPRVQTTQAIGKLSFGTGFSLSIEAYRRIPPPNRPVPPAWPFSTFTPPQTVSGFVRWSVEPPSKSASWQRQPYPPTELGPALSTVFIEVHARDGGPAATIRVRHVPKPDILFATKQESEPADTTPPFEVKVRRLPKPEILIGTKKPKG